MANASVFWKHLLIGFFTWMFAQTQPVNSIDYKSHTWKHSDALEERLVELHIQMK